LRLKLPIIEVKLNRSQARSVLKLLTIQYTPRYSYTYIVHDSSPAFHSYTLEHREHRKEYIVEADDAVLGPLPVLLTLGDVLIAPKGSGQVDRGGTGRKLVLAHEIKLI